MMMTMMMMMTMTTTIMMMMMMMTMMTMMMPKNDRFCIKLAQKHWCDFFIQSLTLTRSHTYSSALHQLHVLNHFEFD